MSQRTEQVGSLLMQEVSSILAKNFEPPQGCLVTVMHAVVTQDLQHAKIFVSILPEQQTEPVLQALKKKTHEVQHILNKRLFMKYVPRISWEVDLTNIKYAQIDEALKR